MTAGVWWWLGGYTARPYYSAELGTLYGYPGSWSDPLTTLIPLSTVKIRKPTVLILLADLMHSATNRTHVGGWNALFVDGHVRWVADDGSLETQITVQPPYVSMWWQRGAFMALEQLAGEPNPAF